MSDPFRLDGPAVISFSGGGWRTSGYMLHRILESHGGTLPDNVKVVFCNTGKERDETLDFVERCSQRWAVPVVWLEYRMNPVGPVVVTSKGGRKTMGRSVRRADGERAGSVPSALCHRRTVPRPDYTCSGATSCRPLTHKSLLSPTSARAA